MTGQKLPQGTIKELLNKAFDGATITHPESARPSEYTVTYPDKPGYYVAVREKALPPKGSEKDKFIAQFEKKDRLVRLMEQARNSKLEATLAWVVKIGDEDQLELVAATLTTLKQIANSQSSPFTDSDSVISYQINCFAEAAEWPGVHTARMD